MIEIIRIDDRLIHAQVVIGWGGEIDPDRYLVADDEVDDALLGKLEETEFIVAQASYWSTLVERADVVLPSTIWAEKSGTFTSTEGRDLPLQAALRPPASVMDDPEILKALAKKVDC